MFSVLISCAICFGSANPHVTYVMIGMLAVPFLMVGGMMTFLYYRGVFRTKSHNLEPESELPTSAP